MLDLELTSALVDHHLGCPYIYAGPFARAHEHKVWFELRWIHTYQTRELTLAYIVVIKHGTLQSLLSLYHAQLHCVAGFDLIHRQKSKHSYEVLLSSGSHTRRIC